VLLLDCCDCDWDNEEDVFLEGEEDDGASLRLLLRSFLLLLRSFDFELDFFVLLLPLLSSMVPLPLLLVLVRFDFFRFLLLLVVLLKPGVEGRITSMMTSNVCVFLWCLFGLFCLDCLFSLFEDVLIV